MDVLSNVNLYKVSLPLGDVVYFISPYLSPLKYAAVQRIINKTDFKELGIDGFEKSVTNDVLEKLDVVIKFLPVNYVFRKRESTKKAGREN